MEVRSLICTYHRMNGISKKHMSKSSPLESVLGTLLRGRVLAEASKLRWGHQDGPRPNNWCPYKGKGRQRHTGTEWRWCRDTKEEAPLKTKAETAVMQSQVQTSWGTRSCQKQKGSSPRASGGSLTCWHFDFYFCRSIHFCCFKATQFVVIYYSNYKTLT